MSNQILIKRSTEAGKIPTSTDLAAGELGVNLTDKKLYCGDGSNVFIPNRSLTDEFLAYQGLPNKIEVGNYFDNTSGFTVGGFYSTAIRGNVFYLTPFIFKQSFVASQLTYWVNLEDLVKQVKFGIYEYNTELDLIYSFDSDITTTGLKVLSTNISFSAEKVYYLGFVSNSDVIDTFRAFYPIFHFGRGSTLSSQIRDAHRVSVRYEVSGLSFGTMPNQILLSDLSFNGDDYAFTVPLICFQIGSFI